MMFKTALQVALLLVSACFFDAHTVEDTCEQRQKDHDFDIVSLLTIKTQLSETPPEDPQVAAQESQDCAKWAPENSCSTLGARNKQIVKKTKSGKYTETIIKDKLGAPKPKECHVFWKWSTKPKYGLYPWEVVMCRNRILTCKAHGVSLKGKTIKKCAAPVFTALQSDIVRECGKIKDRFEARPQERKGDNDFSWSKPLNHFSGSDVVNKFLRNCEHATGSASCLKILREEHTNTQGVSRQRLAKSQIEADPARIKKGHYMWQKNRDDYADRQREGVLWDAQYDMDVMEAKVHFLEFLRGPEDEVGSSKQGLLNKFKMDQGQFDAFKRMLEAYCGTDNL